jgi:hypothetical protein
MAGEKSGGNHPANAGGGNANKGPSKSNRRRSLRSKRRGRKPEEGSEPREQRNEAREARLQPATPKGLEKSVRDNRERRRRRRMRAKQRGPSETTTPVVEDMLKDLPPLVPAFVYTHVLRPAMRDSFEFRTEHFSKVTRKLEDFHIDLSPLYPDGGDEIKGVAYITPLDRAEFAKEFGGDLDDDELADADADDDESESELLEDADWDAEESDDAALLEGATGGVVADDFYENLDDSVLDEYPEEDIDA